MPIFSYQQLVNQLKPQDISNASPETVSQLMMLFAREKKIYNAYAHAENRTSEMRVIQEHIRFGALDTYCSAEAFLSTLTIKEKEAIKKIAQILSWEMARLIRYPKLGYLFAV